ncbi:hypothetical protein TrLO_g12068 [Triparma laevis f. longispina]|uniref:Uncharacterized protein n=1 Tax=Triparma laevis f. longispina TaxID=1714387 RepID=A0A9W7ARP1_9STRA|nr:hypothetical protein TrLO_g12068 [Triparma laevis f. longispina]
MRPQNNHTSKKAQIKRILNPTRLLVRDQYLMLPNAKALCVCLPSRSYEAVLLERITVDERDAIQDELFKLYEARETSILQCLEDDELDELNTCYLEDI